MRDGCPIALMRIQNILAFVNGGAIAEATALLPMTLYLSVVRLDAILRDARSHSLRISCFLVWKGREMREHGLGRKPESVKRGHVIIFTS
jgi:hypothetical protein